MAGLNKATMQIVEENRLKRIEAEKRKKEAEKRAREAAKKKKVVKKKAVKKKVKKAMPAQAKDDKFKTPSWMLENVKEPATGKKKQGGTVKTGSEPESFKGKLKKYQEDIDKASGY